MMVKVTLTSVEQSIFNMLSDGEAHVVDEIIGCLYDAEDGDVVTVRKHISNINKKIMPGHEIVSLNTPGKRRTNKLLYKLVRSIKTSD